MCRSERISLKMLQNGHAGQATVEYLTVALALLVIVVALSVLSDKLSEGIFVEHAAESASHAFTNNTAGSVGDVLLY